MMFLHVSLAETQEDELEAADEVLEEKAAEAEGLVAAQEPELRRSLVCNYLVFAGSMAKRCKEKTTNCRERTNRAWSLLQKTSYIKGGHLVWYS